MSHTHHHDHSKKLGVGILLNVLVTIIEYVAGFFSGSLALISDASHNLTDVISLLVAAIAEKISKKEGNNTKTFGYVRATILGALLNTLIFFLLALYIFYEAYQRLQSPELVSSSIVIVVALVTVVFNGAMAFMFSGDTKDLNMRGVFLHQVYDALSSVGALIAGILIYMTHNPIFDTLISIVIGIMMLVSGWGLARKSLHVLFEGVPEDIHVDEVKTALLALPLAKGIHDLHIWSLSSHFTSLSCHILIDEESSHQSMVLLADVKELLKNTFEITHSTIEIEVAKCQDGVC
jgi:cobalt-zinc-cadmium efflux system protein